MGGLHDIKKKDWERLLKKNGFYLDRSTKHAVWKHEDGRVIPMASTINPCIARRMIKENRLEGAPFGWSERADKQEAKAKAAQERQTQWQEQLQKAKDAIAEQERIEAEERQRKAEELRTQREEEAKRAERERQDKALTERKKAAKPATPTAPTSPAPTTPTTPTSTIKPITYKTLYMNDNRLKKFHEYLCAVVEYYQKNKSLKNFSALAKQYQVKAITQEQFYQSKLDELKPGQKPSRETSDRIRMMMAEDDLKRRQQMLDTFLKAQEQKETEGGSSESAEVKEPTLAEKIDTFELRFDLLGPAFANIITHVYNQYEKEFGNSGNDLLGAESWRVRLSPEPYLKEWADKVEFDLTRLVFDNADAAEVRKMLPSWNDKILHAYLTWLYGGGNGDQLKLNFDERGDADNNNEQLLDLLRDQGLLNDILFAKLETWKGVALCAVIYKDAPDILMIISEDAINYYTIEDNIWYSYCGNTIINPEHNTSFGGWGTRSIVGHCLRQMLSEENRIAATKEQQHVTKEMRGKLMDDINHYRDIWQMYHEEYEKSRQQGMIDFG